MDSESLVTWFTLMNYSRDHPLIVAIQYSDVNAEPQVEPLDGKTLRATVAEGGFSAVLKRVAVRADSPEKEKNAGGSGQQAALTAIRGPVMIAPADAFDRMLTCCSGALRKKGKVLREKWLHEVGCLDGTPVLSLEATGEKEGGEDGAAEGAADGADADASSSGATSDPEKEKGRMEATLHSIGLGAFCQQMQAPEPEGLGLTSISSLNALGVPELAGLAESTGMEAAEILRLSRYLRRRVTTEACPFCAQTGAHSTKASWEVALGGVVGDELATSASLAGNEPKWVARLQKLRHWFDKTPDEEGKPAE